MALTGKSESWSDAVAAAFQGTELHQRILDECAREPDRLRPLFQHISNYVISIKEQAISQSDSVGTKKRKLDNGAAATVVPLQNGTPIQGVSRPSTTFECPDVSFQVPTRKKLKLQFIVDEGDQRRREIRLVHPATTDIEYALAGENIDQAFCLPVPEKQARQMNFVIFPKPGADSFDGKPAEQIVFTMNETAWNGVGAMQAQEDDTYVTITQRELARFLSPYGKNVIIPNENEFASSIPQSHRKGEKAYHVKAHRAAKEGYLFFLSNGIVFGFKKPLAFFPFSSIHSISYTSVLQRTFNLVIAAMDSSDPSQMKEVEFSMLDQEDFAGIDEYIKRHGLNDASMAAERRAKAYNVNKEPKSEANGDVNGGGEPEDGQTELQKAEQQLQDEEDEEEEDYEASGGESDGEGEYSEDEEEYDEVEGEEGEEGDAGEYGEEDDEE